MYIAVQLALLTIFCGVHGYFETIISPGSQEKKSISNGNEKHSANSDKTAVSRAKRFVSFNVFSRGPYKKKINRETAQTFDAHEANEIPTVDKLDSIPFDNVIEKYNQDDEKRAYFNPFLRNFNKKWYEDENSKKQNYGFNIFDRGQRTVPYNTFSRGIKKRIIGPMSRRSSYFNTFTRGMGTSMTKRTNKNGRTPFNVFYRGMHPSDSNKRIFNTFSRGLRTAIYNPMYRGIDKYLLEKRNPDFNTFTRGLREDGSFDVFHRGMEGNTFNTFQRGVQQQKRPAHWNPFSRGPVKRNMYDACKEWMSETQQTCELPGDSYCCNLLQCLRFNILTRKLEKCAPGHDQKGRCVCLSIPDLHDLLQKIS